VSTKPDACPGEECLYYTQCLPRKARSRAGSADVIVTNHALLAVQATTGAPVVIGSRHLRPIDHLVVDEAHALVDVVRNQGSVFINEQRLISAHRAVDRVIDFTRPEDQQSPLARHLADTDGLATMLDDELARRLPQSRAPSPKAIKDDPGLDALLGVLLSWVRALQEFLPQAPSTRSAKGERMFRQMHARVDRLASDLSTAFRCSGDVARWVEYDQTPVLKLSPVDVSGMLRANLFEFVAEDEPEPGQKRGKPRPPVSVSAMSATMPSNFARESGLAVDTKQYPSPFAAAYDASCLYVPKLDPEALEALTTPDRKGKPSLDLVRHQTWAATLITKLVRANAGSALVLSATSAAGQRYVEELRADADGWTVYSQWGGTSVPQVTAEWRKDRNSVLVGTRSLMTGVDAVGDTCSLVIVDRVPRARGNVVDDARVEHMRKQQRVDHVDALRLVYVADAALLLEQATGRLIRSVDDAGMVAVLDPRLIPKRQLSYPEPNRQAIRAGLARFPSHTRITTEDDALAYLRRQAAVRTSLVSVR
jgi:ATP-dependent DNA helicase DinG